MVAHRPAIVAIAVLLGGALLPGASAAKSPRHAHSHTNAHRGPPPISAQAVNDAQFSPSLKLAKPIPHDLVKMARLEHLSYTSPLELLSEKFHVDPKLLQELNPGKRFDEAGTTIFVPNVGERDTSARVAKVEVEKWNRAVRALGEHGEVIAFYPASIGSEDKSAPSGQFKVRRVAYHPKYHYDPKFHFKGVHTTRKLTVAAGPNNPVGMVWIDLTIDSYGIHGTPDPERIGKSYSHGCIRLTNWDAVDLAKRVRKGTPVDFVDEPSSLPAGPGEARGRK